MRVAGFEWDDANSSHATRHGVSQDEIEETIEGASLVRKGKSGVYLAYGQTLDGRFVLVVFQRKERGMVRPFAARPMTYDEKGKLKRWLK
ncbi:MAG: BrnT family toxin [Elusimicrobiota bacterium]